MGLGLSSLRLGMHAKMGGAWFNADSVGSFDFDFANNRYYYDGTLYSAWGDVTGASAATFTRASTGARWTAAGALSFESTDVLRFNHDPANGNARIGVLIEPARTNLLPYNTEYDNAAWTKSNVTISANVADAPDGTTTVDKIVENSSFGQHLIQRLFTSAADVYTTSCFLEPAGRDVAIIRIYNGTTGFAAYYNVSDGTVGTVESGNSASIVSVGGGVYRAICTRTMPSTTSALSQFGVTVADSFISYTGDGASGVRIWGAQTELGATASSVILTSASSATRAADALSIVLPTGTHDLTFTFDDDSTQAVTGQTGTYNVPTNLNRPNIKRVWGVLA